VKGGLFPVDNKIVTLVGNLGHVVDINYLRLFGHEFLDMIRGSDKVVVRCIGRAVEFGDDGREYRRAGGNLD